MRTVRHVYGDPLDRIWLGCARRVGFRVERSSHVYASTDGRGTLTLGTRETLDEDDSTAQMVFHELCHSLVEGEEALARPDFGLDNTSELDVPREEACLRLQAHLAGRHGLRRFLAPTTDFRPFYDALEDPFAPADDVTVLAARLGAVRARGAPWAPHLEEALAATAAVARAAQPFSEGEPDLLGVIEASPGRHPAGFLLGTNGSTCADCGWRIQGREGRDHCRQAGGKRVDPTWPSCERWEPKLDCLRCGACCRAAYHSVTVSRRDPFVRSHPELVERRENYLEIRRDGDRCAALTGGSAGTPYACTVYADRPRSCRDFEQGGVHCLTARRRVGLTL